MRLPLFVAAVVRRLVPSALDLAALGSTHSMADGAHVLCWPLATAACSCLAFSVPCLLVWQLQPQLLLLTKPVVGCSFLRTSNGDGTSSRRLSFVVPFGRCLLRGHCCSTFVGFGLLQQLPAGVLLQLSHTLSHTLPKAFSPLDMGCFFKLKRMLRRCV